MIQKKNNDLSFFVFFLFFYFYDFYEYFGASEGTLTRRGPSRVLSSSFKSLVQLTLSPSEWPVKMTWPSFLSIKWALNYSPLLLLNSHYKQLLYISFPYRRLIAYKIAYLQLCFFLSLLWFSVWWSNMKVRLMTAIYGRDC